MGNIPGNHSQFIPYPWMKYLINNVLAHDAIYNMPPPEPSKRHMFKPDTVVACQLAHHHDPIIDYYVQSTVG